MIIVYIITAVLIVLVLTAIGIHQFRNRYIEDRWKEQEDELSPIVASPRVSVVVICRNEGHDMEENLPKLFAQKCVDIEVIVVNAASTDSTIDALKRLSLQYPQMRQTYVPNSNTNFNVWESAYMLGARAARNEWVLFVSPKFRPASDLWMLDILRYADPLVKAVIDYENTSYGNPSESKYAWKRRCKKMTRTVRKGRAIVCAGGSMLIKRSWALDHSNDSIREECVYICRRFQPLQRLILRVQNRRPRFEGPL